MMVVIDYCNMHYHNTLHLFATEYDTIFELQRHTTLNKTIGCPNEKNCRKA